MAFSKGESVYAYHGDVLYPAKILSVTAKGDKFHYSIHYQNWGSKHDEIVPPERLVKENSHLAQQAKQAKIVAQQVKSDLPKGKRKAGEELQSVGKKSKEDDDVEDSGIRVELPILLASILKQDYFAIVSERKIFSPREFSIRSILLTWVAEAEDPKGSNAPVRSNLSSKSANTPGIGGPSFAKKLR